VICDEPAEGEAVVVVVVPVAEAIDAGGCSALEPIVGWRPDDSTKMESEAVDLPADELLEAGSALAASCDKGEEPLVRRRLAGCCCGPDSLMVTGSAAGGGLAEDDEG